jgi:hypothetical protein
VIGEGVKEGVDGVRERGRGSVEHEKGAEEHVVAEFGALGGVACKEGRKEAAPVCLNLADLG